MEFQFNDGGRGDAGYKGKTRDCVCRAISIALEIPYQQVYDDLNNLIKNSRKTKHSKKSHSRKGIHKKFYHKYLADKGWKWMPCQKIGVGCTANLKKEDLPNGRLIVRVAKHLTCVIDGVLNDTWDCSQYKTCVYGYFYK